MDNRPAKTTNSTETDSHQTAMARISAVWGQMAPEERERYEARAELEEQIAAALEARDYDLLVDLRDRLAALH